MAKLPILSVKQPLFAFANVHYRLDRPQPVPFAPPTSTYAISSLLHTATPQELSKAKVKATDKPSLLIDDFSHDWRDWYTLNANNPHHWQYWTRKLTDPKWCGPDGSKLSFDVKSQKPNELVVVITQNFFRPYRGKKTDFVAVGPLKGGKPKTIRLSPADFKSVSDGSPLNSWDNADILGFRAHYNERRVKAKFGSPRWAGSQPTFRNLRWEK